MFAVEVLTFTHLRQEKLEKIEYRNTEFYFDFRFSIFAPLAFLCSNLYYSERAHCEYHVRSEVLTFTHLRKKNLEKIEYRNTNFISIFVFRYSPPWRFCAQICTIANVLIREYHVRSEGTHFHPSTKEKLGKI